MSCGLVCSSSMAPSVPASPPSIFCVFFFLRPRQLDCPFPRCCVDCALFVHGSVRRHHLHPREEGCQGRHADDIRLPIRLRSAAASARPWDHRRPSRRFSVAALSMRLAGAARIAAEAALSWRRWKPKDVRRGGQAVHRGGVESVRSACSTAFATAGISALPRDSWRSAGTAEDSLSSDVMPTMGRVRAWASTARGQRHIAPKVTSYLDALTMQLRQLGLPNLFADAKHWPRGLVFRIANSRDALLSGPSSCVSLKVFAASAARQLRVEGIATVATSM